MWKRWQRKYSYQNGKNAGLTNGRNVENIHAVQSIGDSDFRSSIRNRMHY